MKYIQSKHLEHLINKIISARSISQGFPFSSQYFGISIISLPELSISYENRPYSYLNPYAQDGIFIVANESKYSLPINPHSPDPKLNSTSYS
jgi:hypothetical protein